MMNLTSRGFAARLVETDAARQSDDKEEEKNSVHGRAVNLVMQTNLYLQSGVLSNKAFHVKRLRGFCALVNRGKTAQIPA
jgi:hypothetical protein